MLTVSERGTAAEASQAAIVPPTSQGVIGFFVALAASNWLQPALHMMTCSVHGWPGGVSTLVTSHTRAYGTQVMFC